MVQMKVINDLSFLIQLNQSNVTYVLLHGFPDTKEVWLPVLNQIKGANCIALDLPSFGLSKIVDDAHMEMDMIADKIIQSLSILGIDSFSLVGHDWGGFIAWAIYSKAPQCINSITLTNATHPKVYCDLLKTSALQRQIGKYATFFTTPGAAARLMEDQAKALKLYHPFVEDEGPGSRQFFEEKWHDYDRLNAALGIYRANFENIVQGRVPLVKAHVPVRVFWGKGDHSLVVENATSLEAYCTAAFAYEFVEGGHWAFVKQAAAFCRFLESTHEDN